MQRQRIKNKISSAIFLALLFNLLITGKVLSSTNLFECMKSCILYEGGNTSTNNKTCKSRCAQIPITGQGGKSNKDCMAIFKECNVKCNNNTKCKKECKINLMNCK